MFRYFRFYLGPLFMVVIASLMLLGNYFLWLPSLIYLSGVALLDQMFPYDMDEDSYRFPFLLDLALYMSTPAALTLYMALFWMAGSGNTDALGIGQLFYAVTGVDAIAARNETGLLHYILLFPAIAVPATAVGGLAGHELVHRLHRPFDLWLGRCTMALNWGIAFPIEHVYGHHAYVGTPKDPATAARGDSVYRHLPKAMYRTVVNAYEIESKRLRKSGKPFISSKNVLLRLACVSLATSLFAFYCAGWLGVLFHIIVCFLTKFALEVLNYIEHYGLIRPKGRPVQPHHSWNCNHVVSGVTSYNLTRHSHHHANARTPYHELTVHEEQPEMPGGLMTAYFSALVPSLWRRRIVPKLLDWDSRQAKQEEYALIQAANEDSGWPELLDSHCNSVTKTATAC